MGTRTTRDDHAGHDHDDHAGHDHDDHAGHDHDDHAGHDHDDHAGHDHDDHAGHDHDDHHDHDHDFSDASMRSLVIALALISGFMVAEVVGGIISGSLALLADAGHMITDAAAIGLALFALAVSRRRASGDSTFGYRRAEVLATMINVISLWLIAAWLMVEAYHRVVHLGHDHVEPIKVEWMLGVGGVGLVVNILAAWVLHSSSQHNMNVEGAMKHVLADMLGSVGVIVSAIVIYFTGWDIIDPILTIVIVGIILTSAWPLALKVVRVLMANAPENIDVYRMCDEVLELEGVTIIHDVHIWSLVRGYDMATARILVDPSLTTAELERLRLGIRDILVNKYSISHATIQLEQSTQTCVEDHHVDNLVVVMHSERESLRF